MPERDEKCSRSDHPMSRHEIVSDAGEDGDSQHDAPGVCGVAACTCPQFSPSRDLRCGESMAMIRGPTLIALREKLARFSETQKKSCSLGPRTIANRSRTREFRSILRHVRRPGDWGGSRVDLNSRPLLRLSSKNCARIWRVI